MIDRPNKEDETRLYYRAVPGPRGGMLHRPASSDPAPAKEPGQVAFEAYYRHPRIYHPRVYREWRNSMQHEREGWASVEKAVLEAAGVERLREEVSRLVQRRDELQLVIHERDVANAKHVTEIQERAEKAEAEVERLLERDRAATESIRRLTLQLTDEQAEAAQLRQAERELRAKLECADRRANQLEKVIEAAVRSDNGFLARFLRWHEANRVISALDKLKTTGEK